MSFLIITEYLSTFFIIAMISSNVMYLIFEHLFKMPSLTEYPGG